MEKKSFRTPKECAEYYVGNFLKWDSFCWLRERPEDIEQWCIIETHHRDSPVIDFSNGEYFRKKLMPFTEGEDPDVKSFGSNHWAVGWVEGWAIRVYGPDGKITKAFKALYRIFKTRELASILDEADYKQRMAKAVADNIRFCAYHCRDDRSVSMLPEETLPKNWIAKVKKLLDEMDSCWTDDLDEQGVPSPRSDSVQRAVLQLGYAERDEEESTG